MKMSVDQMVINLYIGVLCVQHLFYMLHTCMNTIQIIHIMPHIIDGICHICSQLTLTILSHWESDGWCDQYMVKLKTTELCPLIWSIWSIQILGCGPFKVGPSVMQTWAKYMFTAHMVDTTPVICSCLSLAMFGYMYFYENILHFWKIKKREISHLSQK